MNKEFILMISEIGIPEVQARIVSRDVADAERRAFDLAKRFHCEVDVFYNNSVTPGEDKFEYECSVRVEETKHVWRRGR